MAAPHGPGSNPAVSSRPGHDDNLWLSELRELIHRRASDAASDSQPARDGNPQRTSMPASLLEREPVSRPAGSGTKATSPKPLPRRKPTPLPSPKPHSSAPTGTSVPPSSVQTGTRNDVAGAPAGSSAAPRPSPRPSPRPVAAEVSSPCQSPKIRRKTIGPARLPRAGKPGGDSDAFTWNTRWPTIRDTATVDVATPSGGSRPAPSRGRAKVYRREVESAVGTVVHGRPSYVGPARGAAAVPTFDSVASPTQLLGPLPRPAAFMSPVALGPRHRHDQPITPTPRPVSRPPRKEPLARRVVRTSGELLITLGLVVMLFAGYEVYGKTWQINAEQSRLTEALDQKWDQAGAQTPVASEPIPGEGIARLHAPILGKKWVVVQGVMLKDIKNAPGHYPDSQMPHEFGNFAIAGHRTPAIFWNLDKLSNGDAIVLETSTDWYVYRVYSNKIVLPTKTDVVDANPDRPGATPTRKVLTLTTCNPKWDNYERLIIHGEQTRSQSKSQGRPSELGA